MSDPAAGQMIDQIKGQRSILNPMDASSMVQDGSIDPNMSVDDFLTKLGVDPKGPVSQLISMAQDQTQKANPVNKMQAFARGPGGQPPGQPPAAAPQGGGLKGLLGGM